MKKLSKLIATTTLAMVMFVSNFAPAMATESPQNLMSGESVESVDVAQSRAMIASYYYEGAITAGKTLNPVSINGRPKTINFCVNGSGGNVIIRLTNRTTGDSRSFTAVANGSWGSITYVSNMDSGIYDVKVQFVSGSGHNKVWMEFYN